MAEPLWTGAEIAEATGGALKAPFDAAGIDIDTRTLRPGDLFVALTAARDGHDFVADALAEGAAGALVSRVPEGVPADAPLVVVPDVLAGLAALGRAGRARTRARVVAVTGSVGKTSTKEMMRTAFGAQRRTHAAQASYNNHWGVPITLALIPKDAEIVVAEIGMNAPGEIAPLSDLARPHVALITAIAPAHLEAFGRIEGIAEEKASIVSGLTGEAHAVLPADAPTFPILRAAAEAKGAQIRTFGTRGDWRLGDVTPKDGRTRFHAATPAGALEVTLDAAGRHFASNALGVLAVAETLGLDVERAARDLGRWRPADGRGVRETARLPGGGEVTLLDDAFNSNPASLGAALEVLASTHPGPEGRRIAVLGDMLELGEDEATIHAAVADDPHMAAIDRVHAVGPLMRHLHDALPANCRAGWHPDAAAAAAAVGSMLRAGDVVLVKGSKASKVSRVVAAIRASGRADRPEGS
ncbi:UDP-N-acetylmuramoyl-tripeptide--D-alanyl-D-alanine ligase [Hasllibacter halocynthiae]|uniref:UDP-N-acetylmuramoyl-tripeptide--D-alanyl-D-alanine ligase n=1 Tax=Hasllibacter halocynthiae TaxID=595589 RepID=A0A2T0X7C0_9RHOB|nr:UDP-N-acetylmuramoyl-tripeptide--D-alanyl-D-alanine ligase [Hasllibacter halocynthiae]PRY94823.1 UDP-N-acetylmuramoyl-tripeptide--D-alanyl-D-alanine ligase [Hasllibacter halocynthiae]